MPRIAEIREIDGEIWCRVGKLGEFESGIALWTPDEQQAWCDAAYQQGRKDAVDEKQHEKQREADSGEQWPELKGE